MFNFDVFNNPEPHNIYLCKPNKKIICELNGIDDSTASITVNLNNQYELSFDYFRYVYDDNKQELIESNGYHKLSVGMKILVENIGYFKMNYPPLVFDGDVEKKTITASSIECELENKDITLKINTGEEDSLEYLVVYDENETESLLNDYTGLPYDYIVFYNTFPEQLQELLNKYSDGTYTSTTVIEEIKNYCDLIPRLVSKLNTDSNGDTTVEEYVAFTYDDSGKNISSVKLTNFNSRIQTLITFYTKYRNQLSLVSLITDKCSPNWKLGKIDSSLYNKKFQFDINNKNIYSFLTQDLSSASNCIFKFNIFNNTIDMISVDNIGEESGVVIDKQVLLNNLEVSCDENSIYTRYSVSGGDGLGIEYVNFGEPYIDDISYFLNAKDENGERIYVSDSLAEKYKLYQEDKDIARKTYSDLTAQYNHYTEEIFELKYRLPNDIVSTDWGTYKMEELEAAVTTYNNLLCTLQTCYKEDYGTAGCNSDGSINENYIKNTEYWYDYYAYKQALDQISEAIDCLANDTNYRYIDDEQILAKINAWKTEWTLYGTVELQNKIVVYENNMKVLIDGEAVVLKTNSEEAKTWSELTNTEKQEYNNIEANYQYEVYNQQYTERNSCQEYLNTLLVKLDSLETSQNSVQNQRVNITKLVSLTGYNRIELNKIVILNAVSGSNSFTESEIADINLLYIDKNYSNENIITTSIDSIETEIDIQYELLEDAKEKLSIDSQPQISFTADIDNLLAMPEFKDFDFNIGNYVIVQYYDDYYVKLRLESLQFNPRVPSDELTVTFTNYIKSRSKRTDVSYILGQATGSSGSSSSSVGAISSGIGLDEISNTLLSKLLNTEMFGSKVSNLILDTLKLNELNTKYLKVDGLSKGTTIIDGKCVQTGYIRDKYYNGKNGDISNTKGSVINLETGNFNLAGGSIIFNGTNVTFGENVTLSWNQITDKEGVGGLTEEEVTQITKDTVSTATIKASQIYGDTLTLGGSNNTNGILAIKNASGNIIVQGDKDGLTVKNGNIVADAIKSGTLDATKITVNGLIVGENVTMGDNATISWNQVENADSQVTQITKNTVTTSYVNALNIKAKEVNTDWVYAGKIKANQIYGDTLTLGGNNNVNGQLVIKDASGNTIVTGNKDGLTINKGTIAWSNVTGTSNVASKDDIPSDEYITQITKNTVTTSYVNALNIKAKTVDTDAIKSSNYSYSSGNYSTAGTFLNLSDGSLRSKNIFINSSGSLYMRGDIEATSGSLDKVIIKSLYIYDETNNRNVLALANGDGEVLEVNCGLQTNEDMFVLGTLHLYDTIWMGDASKKEKNIYFTNNSGGTYEHDCKLYGGYSESKTGIGLYDSKNDRSIWVYNDVDNIIGSDTTLKTTSVNVSRDTTNCSAISYSAVAYPFLKLTVFHARFTANALTAGNTVSIGTLTSTYAPKTVSRSLAAWVNSSVATCNCSAIISTEGNIQFHSTEAIASGKYIYVSGAWSY